MDTGMVIKTFKNISNDEIDKPVWRYLTLFKFMSMMTYQALWFPKLNILQDQFEGTLPPLTRKKMDAGHQILKQNPIFNTPDLHRQIDEMSERKVQDGRELTVVNCWFMGEEESKLMWDTYAPDSTGVAIRSSVKKLASCIALNPEYSILAKVRYVDFNTYEMKSMYEANQTDETACLKNLKYAYEREVRVITLNLKTHQCVNMDGTPMTDAQRSEKGMSNFENPGLYIVINIDEIFDSITLAPGASKEFEMLIKRIIQLCKLNVPVLRSAFQGVR